MDNIVSKDQNSIKTDNGVLVFVSANEKEDLCSLCAVLDNKLFKSCAGIPCSKKERLDKKAGYYTPKV